MYQIDLRYAGQAMQLTVDMTQEEFSSGGLPSAGKQFNAMHEKMFTFALETGHELYNLRALVQGRESTAKAEVLQTGSSDAAAAAYMDTNVYVAGREQAAKIYDRSLLLAGNRIAGPAIVTEMDATTLILPDHDGEVDTVGNILIRPV
jgi:N-methylhydantoinase A